MAGIRFEGVSKTFRDVAVIKELDLTIEDGEFFTFVGPSGCGKSTILNMIAGLEPVTKGKIYFDGAPVNDLTPRERDVAVVFQSYALYPHMTVHENIAFPLRMKKIGAKTIDKEVRRVAAVLGLDDLLHRRPKELSGGQRQRVALGRAMIRKPKVFLMDEPLSNLDARLRIEMRAELKRLHQDLKTTTIYVTHDQAEAMSLSGRIGVLYCGELQQCGTPAEVYLRPSNVFVAGFIGSPPMNFIPGVIRSRDPLQVECNGAILSPGNALLLPSRVEVRRVLVGIRPEEISVYPERTERWLEVTVSLIEPAGPNYWVDCDWKGTKIKGTAKEVTNLNPGGKAFLSFAKERIVVFDAESEKILDTR
jgi:multiple sugar transport system ATP-binding protein